MKKTPLPAFVLLASLFLSGCATSPVPSSPVPLVLNKDYQSRELSPSPGSQAFSTALFLKDLGLFEDIPPAVFEVYSQILFGALPLPGEVKEMVLPALSPGEGEQAALLFLSHDSVSQEITYYRMDTNLPQEIVMGGEGRYNGYIIQTDQPFYPKEEIPPDSAAILYIAESGGIVQYIGASYPGKSAPLIFSKTGIAPDAYMQEMVNPGTTPLQVSVDLSKALDLFTAMEKDNPRFQETLPFLEKHIALSSSAYHYIGGETEKAEELYRLSLSSPAPLPDTLEGERYTNLQEILRYLLEIL